MEETKKNKVKCTFNCNACGKLATKKCSICEFGRYCNRECQIQDWPEHQKICSHWAQRKHFLPRIREVAQSECWFPWIHIFDKLARKKGGIVCILPDKRLPGGDYPPACKPGESGVLRLAFAIPPSPRLDRITEDGRFSFMVAFMNESGEMLRHAIISPISEESAEKYVKERPGLTQFTRRGAVAVITDAEIYIYQIREFSFGIIEIPV